MKRLIIGTSIACFGLALAANAQIAKIMNAASLSEDAVAPGSIVTIKGTRLANSVAKLSDGSNIPYTLGGVTLTVGGFPASLFYVSPTQVNARIDTRVPLGRANVLLISPAGQFSATVNVAASAPGLFSMNGSGVGDGAIIHATTFAISAFGPRTGDSPTFLSLFATGLDLSEKPIVRIGGVIVPVLFAGDVAPAGLQQINVQLLDALAGAGRVGVVVESKGVKSNTVELVLLPAREHMPFPSNRENEVRNREISSLASVPNTSLVLVTDENDDVVRVADAKLKTIVRTIILPTGAKPMAVAVNASGTTAVVAERGRAKVAIVDLTKNVVASEMSVGNGPVAVAILGDVALAANQEDNTVSIFSLQNLFQVTHLPVGKAPRGIAVDPAGIFAYVACQDAGSLNVINTASRTVTGVIQLGADARPQAIAVAAVSGLQKVAVVTDPGAGPDGKIYLVDLASGAATSVSANPDRTGGPSDIAVFGNMVYIANQTGGSVSFAPISASTFAPKTIRVGMGARALAVDALDKLLVVANQGSGNLSLIDLNTNLVVGQIDAVRRNNDDDDDREDREHGVNIPVVTSLSPATAKAGASFTLIVSGTGLGGATDVHFVESRGRQGRGNDHSDDEDDNRGKGPSGDRDTGFTVSNISVNTAGTQLTAQVRIDATHAPATRVVRVATPNGESSFAATSGNTFTVTQ